MQQQWAPGHRGGGGRCTEAVSGLKAGECSDSVAPGHRGRCTEAVSGLKAGECSDSVAPGHRGRCTEAVSGLKAGECSGSVAPGRGGADVLRRCRGCGNRKPFHALVMQAALTLNTI